MLFLCTSINYEFRKVSEEITDFKRDDPKFILHFVLKFLHFACTLFCMPYLEEFSFNKYFLTDRLKKFSFYSFSIKLKNKTKIMWFSLLPKLI